MAKAAPKTKTKKPVAKKAAAKVRKAPEGSKASTQRLIDGNVVESGIEIPAQSRAPGTVKYNIQDLPIGKSIHYKIDYDASIYKNPKEAELAKRAAKNSLKAALDTRRRALEKRDATVFYCVRKTDDGVRVWRKASEKK